MISNLLHLVGLRPRVYYTLTNFRGGGVEGSLAPPPLNTPMQGENSILLKKTMTGPLEIFPIPSVNPAI